MRPLTCSCLDFATYTASTDAISLWIICGHFTGCCLAGDVRQNSQLTVPPLVARGFHTYLLSAHCDVVRYGEDPILTKKLLQGFVAGLQDGEQTTNGLGERIYETIATCKHFVGYSVDEMPPRLSFDPNVTQVDLWQYFFPAWEACAKSAVSVMCAYNGMNGYPMCMSPMIDEVLRAKFNFTARPENYVVTDSGGARHRFSSILSCTIGA